MIFPTLVLFLKTKYHKYLQKASWVFCCEKGKGWCKQFDSLHNCASETKEVKKKQKPTQGHSRASNTQRKETPLWHPWFLKTNRLTGTRSSLSAAFNSKVQPRTLSSEKRLWLMPLLRGGKPEGMMATDHHSVLVWVVKRRARGRVGFRQLFCPCRTKGSLNYPMGEIHLQTDSCVYGYTHFPPTSEISLKQKENTIQTPWKTIAHLD